MGSDGARVTVAAVITAYKRRDYLEQAIRSVIDQTDPADEVVVVKSFADPAMEDRWTRSGVRFISLGECPMGASLASGIGAISSDVVSFLDDDDVWMHDKIAHVREVFKDPDVRLHRHRYRAFGPGEATWDRNHEQPGDASLWPLRRGPTASQIAWICRTSAYTNSSTISIGRPALLPLIPSGLIERTEGGLDIVVPIGSMLAGGKHVFDSTVRSQLRRHEAESASLQLIDGRFQAGRPEIARQARSVLRLRGWLRERGAEPLLPGRLASTILRYQRALLAGGPGQVDGLWTIGDTVHLVRDAVARRQPYVAREALRALIR